MQLSGRSRAGLVALVVSALSLSIAVQSRAVTAGDDRLDHIVLEATAIDPEFFDAGAPEFRFTCTPHPTFGTAFQFHIDGTARGESFEGTFGGQMLVILGEPGLRIRSGSAEVAAIVVQDGGPVFWPGLIVTDVPPGCSIVESTLYLTFAGMGGFAFSSSDGHSAGVPGYIDGAFEITSEGALVSSHLRVHLLSVGDPFHLALSPTSDTSAGTSHTITATAGDYNHLIVPGPVSGARINFAVVGASNVNGECTTDVNGLCSFTYSAPAVPGVDLIIAYADGNGNHVRDPWEPQATATKSWGDHEPPAITAPADINVSTATGTCAATVSNAALGTAAATDNVAVTSITRIPAGNAFAYGQTAVTWTATDAAGNSASATQVVNVADNERPSIAAPPTVSVLAADASGTTVPTSAFGIASATDNCPGVAVNVGGVPAGNLFPIGSTTLTWTATDTSGNTASATQTVFVRHALCLLFDQTKAARLGSTVPIKLRPCTSSGASLSAEDLTVHATSVRQISGTASGVLNDSGNANPDNDFRYDAETGTYTFNLSTKGLDTGTWELSVTVGGLVSPDYAVRFQVR